MDDSVDRDVFGPVDADVVQQMVLCKDVPADVVCFDADGQQVVKHANADVV